MIPTNGWIKLHRQITDWQHWSNPNVLATFIHLLTMANWEDKQWQGLTIQRGQLMTSQPILSEETGIPRTTLRRALSTLQDTGEIKVEVVQIGKRKEQTLITVLNYEAYQGDDEMRKSDGKIHNCTANEMANGRPTNTANEMANGKASLQNGFEGVDTSSVANEKNIAHHGGVAMTKEYIRSNKNNILTTTTRERKENENEKKLDGGHSQVNTEKQGEKKEKNCAKKERKETDDYTELRNNNSRIVAGLKSNVAWVNDTATICKTNPALVVDKLAEFELSNNTNFHALEPDTAPRHFVKWLRLSTDIDSRRSRARQKATRKPTPQADKDPNAAWRNPQIQAMLQRNREESARQLREFRERQQLLQAQKQ